ncbi:GAF protein [Apiospora marii]|uniref:GAF protein n=1 Tax=Apiospora marii TaxID=335849 RepID=UPI0031320D72
MVSALQLRLCACVHADASNFAQGVTKQQAYDQVLLQAEGLFDGQRNWKPVTYPTLLRCYGTRTSPSRSLVPMSIGQVQYPSPLTLCPLSHRATPPTAGFYTFDVTGSAEKPRLILGPFQGKVACQTIYFGRGVCGAAASTRATQLVRDVDQFPGHIACDGDSKSEIVVPIVADDKVVAIIDIDCAVLDGFDEVDQAALEKLAALLARSCDWS